MTQKSNLNLCNTNALYYFTGLCSKESSSAGLFFLYAVVVHPSLRAYVEWCEVCMHTRTRHTYTREQREIVFNTFESIENYNIFVPYALDFHCSYY
jgi:hypothetical protein